MVKGGEIKKNYTFQRVLGRERGGPQFSVVLTKRNWWCGTGTSFRETKKG